MVEVPFLANFAPPRSSSSLLLFTLFFFVFFSISCLLLPSSLSHQCTSSFYSVFLQHIFSAASLVHISFPTSHTLSTTHPCHPYHSSHATISHPFLCISPCLQLHAYYLVSAYHHAFSSMPLAHFSFLIITSLAPYLTITLHITMLSAPCLIVCSLISNLIVPYHLVSSPIRPNIFSTSQLT